MQIPTRNADSQNVQVPAKVLGVAMQTITNQGLEGKTESTHVGEPFARL